MTSLNSPDGPEDAAHLRSLLRWYAAMGADAAVDAEPHDRFAAVDAAPSLPLAPRPISAPGLEATPSLDAAPGPALPRRALPERTPLSPPTSLNGPPPSAEALIRRAEDIAAGAGSLEELRTRWEAFDGCALSATASKMIFADGNPQSGVMIIGAAPGSDDERQGQAFAGPQGRLLDAMLRAIARSRDTAYLTNVIPWRPPGNRPPTPLEAALCLPFTRRHITLADPAVVLCLGERAAQLLLDTREPMAKLRGRWHRFEGDTSTVKLSVTFSLDYLLTQPLQKKRAWLDLLGLARMLDTKA